MVCECSLDAECQKCLCVTFDKSNKTHPFANRFGTISADSAFDGSSLACYSFTVQYTGKEKKARACHRELLGKLSALPYVVHASDNA